MDTGRRKPLRISFIGMPTVGKTKIGTHLAARIGCLFVDIDDCIADRYGAASLQEVVDKLASEEFARIEETIAIEVIEMAASRNTPIVISTGGSVVYSERIMACLETHTHIIHLEASLETVGRRVAKHPDRGIVFAPGETLADLYVRRMPLYRRWAHRTIRTDDRRIPIANQLFDQLRAEGLVA